MYFTAIRKLALPDRVSAACTFVVDEFPMNHENNVHASMLGGSKQTRRKSELEPYETVCPRALPAFAVLTKARLVI